MIDLELALQALHRAGVKFEVSGVEYRCLSLARLVHVKRAAGRPKDFEVVAELEALREERRDRGTA
jgi:hypothetical protein